MRFIEKTGNFFSEATEERGKSGPAGLVSWEVGERRFKVKGYALFDYANKIYFSRPLSDLAALARKEGLTYIFTRSRSDGAEAGIKRLFNKSGWTVYWVE